jgi:ferric-dicitrate binding protein FerR (iron transport regulator)
MDNSHVENLIAKKLTGQLSSEESAELQTWMNASPENLTLLEEYEKMWQSFAPEKAGDIPDAHIELGKLKQRLNISPELNNASILHMNDRTQDQSKSTPILANFRIYAVAASIILMLTCGYLLKFFLFSDTIIKTAYAETKEVLLSDGSVIQLNSGSELSYPDNFNDQARLVRLSGEAFFKVKGADIPFIVRTENSTIRVVGTRFNVHSRNNKTTLIVQEGSVAFASNEYSDEELILNANEMSICKDLYAPDPVRKINADKLLGWLNGILVFDEATIYEVEEELERTYNVEIDVVIQKFPETISGSFKEQSIDNVIEAVCMALGLNHVKEDDKYILFNTQY